MSNAADGFGAPGPPPPGQQSSGNVPSGYPPPGYPPPGYGPPPGWYGPPPGYGHPPGWYGPPPGWYGPPPGYAPAPGYLGPPGYPAPGYPPALKPGVIPLRPLSLAEIFNGAIGYVRANPKASLGLTTFVVVAAQIITLILQVGPLAAAGQLEPAVYGKSASTAAILGSSLSGLAGLVITGLSGILLSGMLTVVVGRAVFGSGITIGEAWQRLRGRFLALLGFTALAAVAVIVLVAVVAVVVGVAYAANGAAAFIVGIPLGLGTIALLVYLFTVLSFVAPLIVLERLGVAAAIPRSFALVRNDFWRVLGIRVLAAIVVGVIAAAVSVPFSIGGQVLLLSAQSTSGAVAGLIITAVGATIGQIITAPFTAGVTVLLYTDRRIRAEAFDLMLQTGAAAAFTGPADSTDQLWLTRRP